MLFARNNLSRSAIAALPSLILEGSERTGKCEDGADVIGAERRIVRDDIVDGIPAGKRAEHLRHKDARTADDWSAVAYSRIHFDSVNAVFHGAIIPLAALNFKPKKPRPFGPRLFGVWGLVKDRHAN